MLEALPIVPFSAPVNGVVRVPGSKSLTNRLLALAALAEGPVTLTGALFSRDTRLMAAALRTLGLRVVEDEVAQTIAVEGQGGHWPVSEATLDVGNAGTAARFLTALLATRPGGKYTLDGDEAMRRRPMRGLLEALAAQGARLTFHGVPGCFPVTLETGPGLPGGPLLVDAAASSQILSGLLMAAPRARAPLTLQLAGATVSEPFVEMTLAVLRQWGATITRPAPGTYTVAPGALRAPSPTLAVEPDATAASYFLALPLAVGGEVFLPGLSPRMLQGDIAFAEVLTACGVEIEATAEGMRSRSPGWRRLGATGGGWLVDADFGPISDTFLTLAALAPLLPGPVRLRGLAHTRHQETDRLHAMATELAKTGARIEEGADSLALQPRPDALRGAAAQGLAIATYEDHRVAMSHGILGSADVRGDGTPWLTVLDPLCCRKTYPKFFEVLAGLRKTAA